MLSRLITFLAIALSSLSLAKDLHIFISVEGGPYCIGGAGIFVNKLIDDLTELGHDNWLLLPDNSFIEGSYAALIRAKFETLSTEGNYQVAKFNSPAKHTTLLIKPPASDPQSGLFSDFIKPQNHTPEKLASLEKQISIPKTCTLTESHTKSSIVRNFALNLMFESFYSLSANYIADELTLINEEYDNIYIHDNFWSASISHIQKTLKHRALNANHIKTVAWIHNLDDMIGLPQSISKEYTAPYCMWDTENLDITEVLTWPEENLPARINGLLKTDFIVTVSQFARQHYLENHKHLSYLLKTYPKPIQVACSTPDLSIYDLASRYQALFPNESIPSSSQEIKSAFKRSLHQHSDQIATNTNPFTYDMTKPILMYTARASLEKGIKHMIEFVRKHPEFFYVIVSREINFEGYLDQFRELINRGNLILLDTEDKQEAYKLNLMAAADFALLPSESENFPLTTGEFSLMGCYVVASDVGGVTETLHDCEQCRTILKPASKDMTAWHDTLDSLSSMTVNPESIVSHAKEKYQPLMLGKSVEAVLKPIQNENKE